MRTASARGGQTYEVTSSTLSQVEPALETLSSASATGVPGVSDEVWANAAKHYDDEQLADLVSQIAVINTFNRGNVILRRPAGDYEVGQLG